MEERADLCHVWNAVHSIHADVCNNCTAVNFPDLPDDPEIELPLVVEKLLPGSHGRHLSSHLRHLLHEEVHGV